MKYLKYLISVIVILSFNAKIFATEGEKVSVQSHLGDPIPQNTISGLSTIQTMVITQTPENLAKIVKNCQSDDKYLLANREACESALGIDFNKRWAEVNKGEVKEDVGKKTIIKKKIPSKPMLVNNNQKEIDKLKEENDALKRRLLEPPPPPPMPLKVGKVIFFGADENELIQVQDQSMDLFSYYQNAQGLQKRTASYPVDLTRVITTAKSINAVLVTEINSQLDGAAQAVVQNNVYGEHGNKILIPAGSKLMGSYKGSTANGQKRLGVVWDRVLTPNGINIILSGYSVDIQGRAGITGEVDNRYLERYGFAMFSSLAELAIAQGMAEATRELLKKNPENGQIILNQTEGTGDNFNLITKQILADHLNLRPIIKIPYGTEFMIKFPNDVVFKEPVGNVINIVAIQEIQNRNDAVSTSQTSQE